MDALNRKERYMMMGEKKRKHLQTAAEQEMLQERQVLTGKR